MRSKLEVFKDEHCFTKEEVQQFFLNFIENNWENSEDKYTETYRKNLLELSDRFKESLNKCHLPVLTDNWWYYDFTLRNDGIELNLFYCNELELDEDGELSGTTSTQEFTLLDIKCDYLKVGQFANIHNVTETTVRQWIRRGKLRTAKKIGRDWLIPSIAERPTRGFRSVSYHWKWLPPSIVEEFPFLKNVNFIYIYQNQDNKKEFFCILRYFGLQNQSKLILNAPEREKLELALIGNDLIVVD